MQEQAKPQTVSQMFPSKYLKAEDLSGKSYSLTVVSASVEKLRQFDGSQAWKVVLAFDKAQKLLILNKTQCKALADITGSERFETWPGVTVKLSAGMAQNGKPTIHLHRVSKTESQSAGEKPVPVSEIPVTPQTPVPLPVSANGYHD